MKNHIKITVGTLGILLGIAVTVATLRNLIGWTLTSGVFGASFLAIVVGVLGVSLGILIVLQSYSWLTKPAKPKNNVEVPLPSAPGIEEPIDNSQEIPTESKEVN